MSHHQPTAQANATNPNMVTSVLIASFIIVAALILPRLSFGVTPSSGDGQVEIAQALPTATSEPPTATMLPTSTPVPTAIPTATPAPQTAANAGPVGAGGAAYDPALVAQGQQLFALCSACHGPDARGLPNLGKDLVTSEFIAGLSDDDLMNFIKTGRPIWDPLNTTGIDMPPKGGNPAMTDADISAVIAYVRSLQAGG
ncbi:MAG: cytochrome c [Anaerolineae bacterium]|nr:cytochrome c [Anaerolineae bacterium]